MTMLKCNKVDDGQEHGGRWMTEGEDDRREDEELVRIRTTRMTTMEGIDIVALDAVAFTECFPPETWAVETKAFIEEGQISTGISVLLALINVELHRFRPTHLMFNDSLWLKATSTMALRADVRRIYIIHTAEQLPFGPFAGGVPGGSCSCQEHALLQDIDGIWAVSKAIQSYAWYYGQLETKFILHHPWNYLDHTLQAPRRRRNWDRKYVAMVNPCIVKGGTIFLELARRCPQYDFMSVSSWGSDTAIFKEMKQLPNLRVEQTKLDMEEFWDEVKVLLVPSLWYEAWGLVVVEAQIRGIPVISSDAGAIPEAKLGVPYIIPVAKLTGEREPTETPHRGGSSKSYMVGEQKVDPWVETLDHLMRDRAEYERVSEMARSTTVRWAKGLNPAAHEVWLRELSYNVA